MSVVPQPASPLGSHALASHQAAFVAGAPVAEAESSSLRIRRYRDADRANWDNWIRQSKNGTFLFYREYMEYHKDRFDDHSLIFTDAQDEWVAVMPATVNKNNELVSHGGLTYGGLVTSKKTKGNVPLQAFHGLTAYCRGASLKKLRYKVVPHIYHEIPAEDDLYALFRCGAQLIRRDLSSTIRMDSRLPYSKGRKYCLKLAEKAQVTLMEEPAFDEFFELEQRVLEKHNTKPVHTASEMKALQTAFPKNIRLFTARLSGEFLAGLLMYESSCVAHAQYMGANERGKEVGALDALIDHALNLYAGKRFFDFGISTEQDGLYLNEGLLSQKEMFGARTIAYDTYDLSFDR